LPRYCYGGGTGLWEAEIGTKAEDQSENAANEDGRVGVFATLTQSYALVAVGASENFYRCVILGAKFRGREPWKTEKRGGFEGEKLGIAWDGGDRS
jgi:hypothetical protein